MNLLGWQLSSTNTSETLSTQARGCGDNNSSMNPINQYNLEDSTLRTSPVHITRAHLKNDQIIEPSTPTSDHACPNCDDLDAQLEFVDKSSDIHNIDGRGYIKSTGVDNASSESDIQPGAPESDIHPDVDTDYVLESDGCDTQSVSPRSISPEPYNIEDHVEYRDGLFYTHEKSKPFPTLKNDAATCPQEKSEQKQLIKTCSTGDLRMYHKTDLKNKICAAEHRILQLEKKLAVVEGLYRSLALTTKYYHKSENIESRKITIPGIIKVLACGVFILQIGNIFK